MSCRAIHWGTEAGWGRSSVWRWAAPPWGVDIGAETWMRWGREPRRDLEEEVSGQKERKAKRFWGRNELGRFEEQQEGQCAWSRVVKQKVVGRGQTCPDGHRGPGSQGRGALSEVSAQTSPASEASRATTFPSYNQQEPPPHVSFLSPSPAHVVVISISLCGYLNLLFPQWEHELPEGRHGLCCSLPHPEHLSGTQLATNIRLLNECVK